MSYGKQFLRNQIPTGSVEHWHNLVFHASDIDTMSTARLKDPSAESLSSNTRKLSL